jgi:hypothetical protein
MYPNDLKQDLLYSFLYYLPISIVAGYLFFTAGRNPGFVDQTTNVEMQNVSYVEVNTTRSTEDLE